MKAVLISIRPNWCELIAKLEKTIEVRKTKPAIEAPFKCFIYCTKDNSGIMRSQIWKHNNHVMNGKVIGEFICDKIITVDCDSVAPFDPETHEYIDQECCFGRETLWEYTNGYCCYGWHISNLVIYDEPKELSEFYTTCEDFRCEGCEHLKYMPVNSSEYDYECEYDGYHKPINRAPQSWCYVEEVTIPWS